MRDLMAKALKMGFNVSFILNDAFTTIQLLREGKVILSCSIRVESFTESVEDALQGLILDAERHSL